MKLFAAFAEYAGVRDAEFDFHPDMTCASLWEHIKDLYPRVAPVTPLFAIRDEYVPPETRIYDGDQILLFPPVSGG
ncbi:MAG TPA: MoaD/ThiS family protein [Acidobacteriota bacterium]|nr:MoaD/ThiS family protein [Acidobacteriota bacterium]